MTKTYRRGKRQHWETPVCHIAGLLRLTELRDNGASLTIIVEEEKRYSFVWKSYCAYRSTDEAQFIAWDLDSRDSDWQHTHKVTHSRWIADLAEGNDLLEIQYPKLQHFVICTADYCTEVLSTVEPEILELV